MFVATLNDSPLPLLARTCDFKLSALYTSHIRSRRLTNCSCLGIWWKCHGCIITKCLCVNLLGIQSVDEGSTIDDLHRWSYILIFIFTSNWLKAGHELGFLQSGASRYYRLRLEAMGDFFFRKSCLDHPL